MLKPGFVISGALHIIVLMLPVSSMHLAEKSLHSETIELFIITSEPAAAKEEKKEAAPPPRKLFEAREKPAAGEIKELVGTAHSFNPEALGIQEKSAMGREFFAEQNVLTIKSAAGPEKTGEIHGIKKESLSGALKNIAVPPLPDKTSELPETVFGTADGPDFTDRVMPEYPRQALRLNKEATVVLILTIDENGKLANVEILEGAQYGFTEAAVKAVRLSTFRPAAKNGKPFRAKAVLPIKFEIE